MNKIRFCIGMICVGLIISVIGIGNSGILAYLSGMDQKENKVIIGGNRIKIEEQFIPPEELIPGVCFTKNVKVTNIGTTSCYVRIKAVFTDSHMEQYCEIDWNMVDWIYNEEDGYYYYAIPIQKGECTPSLFTKVTLKEDMPESVIEDFDILIYAESYQAEQIDHYELAWKLYQENKPE